MGTRNDVRTTGVLGLITAALLAGSLVLYRGGPPSGNPAGLVRWLTAEATAVRGAAVLWLLAMLTLGLFAVSFRESMWAAVLDHPWVTLLFVQGAAVCATVAVVSTAVVWGMADQASNGTLDAAQAATHLEFAEALLLFATWGLAAPLVVIALALWRHSAIGQVAAGSGIALAVVVLLPVDRTPVLFAFAAWTALVGITLVLQSQPQTSEPSELIEIVG